jgi:hypothetical protein
LAFGNPAIFKHQMVVAGEKPCYCSSIVNKSVWKLKKKYWDSTFSIQNRLKFDLSATKMGPMNESGQSKLSVLIGPGKIKN